MAEPVDLELIEPWKTHLGNRVIAWHVAELLIAEIRDLRTRAVEWVPVGERLPVEGQWILLFVNRDDGKIQIGRNYQNWTWDTDYERIWFECGIVTHWAELPAPPREGGSGHVSHPVEVGAEVSIDYSTEERWIVTNQKASSPDGKWWYTLFDHVGNCLPYIIQDRVTTVWTLPTATAQEGRDA